MLNYCLLHSLAGTLMNALTDKLFVNWKKGLKHNIPSIATETYLDLPAMTIEDIRKALR